MVSVHLYCTQLRLEPGDTVIAHCPDGDLRVAEALPPATAIERVPGGLAAPENG